VRDLPREGAALMIVEELDVTLSRIFFSEDWSWTFDDKMVWAACMTTGSPQETNEKSTRSYRKPEENLFREFERPKKRVKTLSNSPNSKRSK